MKAIVLTYDRVRAIREHAILKYQQLWPDHPFLFRIPYQTLLPNPAPDREYVKTPPALKATTLNLLQDLDDEEWVFWCIDDKFPMAFDMPNVNALTAWVQGSVPDSVSAILFCRCCRLLHPEYLTGRRIVDPNGNVYLERKAYEQIWIPQFLRVKVIRHLFTSFPDEIPGAKLMDGYVRRLAKPASHQLYVTESNLAVFGESTRKGILTAVCYRSFLEQGLPLPDWHREVDPRGLVRGELPGFNPAALQ